jgi:hypothetical protein
MRPKTPEQVRDCLIWDGWNSSIAFYEGAKDCRNLSASLIRDSLRLLRDHTAAGKDVRALVEAVRVDAVEDAIQESWKVAIDALRSLFHTSPIGTQRERDRLISIARDEQLVKAMIAAASTETNVDPSWLAVFSAHGSLEASAIVKCQFAEYEGRYPKLVDAILSFKDAHPSTELPAADDRHGGSALPTRLCGGSLTKAQFWAIIENASMATDPAGRLSELLNELEPKNISAFDRHFEAAMDRAYRWDLWAAAYLLLGGCSDDCFSDFCADLILHGKAIFNRVLRNPDTLADYSDVAGDETIALFAAEIYEAKTEHTLPASRRNRPQEPTGQRFNFDNEQEMQRRYPRLFELQATMRKS